MSEVNESTAEIEKKAIRSKSPTKREPKVNGNIEKREDFERRSPIRRNEKKIIETPVEVKKIKKIETPESSKEPVKEMSKEPETPQPPKPPVEPVKEVPQESAKDIPKEPVKELSKVDPEIPQDYNFTRELIADITTQVQRAAIEAVNRRILQLAKVLNIEPEKLRRAMELPLLLQTSGDGVVSLRQGSKIEKFSGPVSKSPNITKKPVKDDSDSEDTPKRKSPKEFDLPEKLKGLKDSTVYVITNYKPKSGGKSQSIAVFGVAVTTKYSNKLKELGFNYGRALTFGNVEAPGWYAPKTKLEDLEKMFKKLKVTMIKTTQDDLEDSGKKKKPNKAKMEDSEDEDSGKKKKPNKAKMEDSEDESGESSEEDSDDSEAEDSYN